MCRRIVIFASGLALVLACMWWLSSSVAGRQHAGKPIQTSTDLCVVFIGLTNNAIARPPSLAVSGSFRGLQALFGVTNTSASRFIGFKTLGIERRSGSNWNEFVSLAGWPTNMWSGMAGDSWAPGFGCICAVAWPFGLSTNDCWRLRLSVSREKPLPMIALNQKLGREIFPPEKPQTITGPDVDLHPAVKLLSAEVPLP